MLLCILVCNVYGYVHICMYRKLKHMHGGGGIFTKMCMQIKKSNKKWVVRNGMGMKFSLFIFGTAPTASTRCNLVAKRKKQIRTKIAKANFISQSCIYLHALTLLFTHNLISEKALSTLCRFTPR